MMFGCAFGKVKVYCKNGIRGAVKISFLVEG
jgi:hypothetical protein